MDAEVTNQVQRRFLEALGRYRLLNPQQLRRVGVANSEETIRREGDVLWRRGLLHHSEPHLLSGITALPRLYWLTDQGAALLPPEYGQPIRGARRELGDGNQIPHRIKTVNAHIALREWAATAVGVEVYRFVTDFEPGSGGRRRVTSISYDGDELYTPDALATVIGPDGLPRPLAYEIERNRRQGIRLTEFREKLSQLREVSERGLVEARFGRPQHRARFIVIFAKADTRHKAVTTWPDPNARAWRNFFVKSEDELDDFNSGWWRPGGASRRPLFPFGPAPQGQTTSPLPAVEGASEAI